MSKTMFTEPTEIQAFEGQATAMTPIVAITPLTLLDKAIERGANVGDIERLAALAERFEDRQSQKTFADALAGFQAECPMVKKVRRTKGGGRFEFDYASLDDVMYVARPLLAKWKIAVTFTTEDLPGKLKITCRVRVGTHSEDTTLTIPVPEMSANDTQKQGGAVAYAKRYAICAALNIVVSDEDDDAASQFDPLTEAQVGEIKELIAQKKVDPERFMAWIKTMCGGIETIEDMPQSLFAKAMDTLKRKKVA